MTRLWLFKNEASFQFFLSLSTPSSNQIAMIDSIKVKMIHAVKSPNDYVFIALQILFLNTGAIVQVKIIWYNTEPHLKKSSAYI